jgi:hypothetical protein
MFSETAGISGRKAGSLDNRSKRWYKTLGKS